MQYGYFDDKHRDHIIQRPDMPLPWINDVGAEGYFGSISNTAGSSTTKSNTANGGIASLTSPAPNRWLDSIPSAKRSTDRAGAEIRCGRLNQAKRPARRRMAGSRLARTTSKSSWKRGAENGHLRFWAIMKTQKRDGEQSPFGSGRESHGWRGHSIPGK